MGKAAPVQKGVPKGSRAGEASGHRMVKTRPLSTSPKPAPLNRNRTSNCAGSGAGARSMSTEVTCARAGEATMGRSMSRAVRNRISEADGRFMRGGSLRVPVVGQATSEAR